MSRPVLAAVALLTLATACGSPTSMPAAAVSSHPPTSSQRPSAELCGTNDLTITLGQHSGAGKISVPIVFTNHSGKTCTMMGYPGAAYVSAGDHHQVGDPAGGQSGPLPTVALRPGESASATLTRADTAAFDPSQCAPTAVWGLRIAPPHSGVPVYFPEADATACANHMASERSWQFHLSVTPVHASATPR